MLCTPHVAPYDSSRVSTQPPNIPPNLPSSPSVAHQQAAMEAEADITLVRRVTCPHCWHVFRPEQVLWVAEHEDLMIDPVVKEEPLRFLPTRYSLEGQALDARGMACHRLACPHCHLLIPRILLENEVTFFSMIGSVGSGKSNLLAAMSWMLRQQLARDFAINFTDADKEANWILNRYEETLFLPADANAPVSLEKTQTQGRLYRAVRMNGQETQLPNPFLFTMHPAAHHPRGKQGGRHRGGAVVCLYDNAGEHFGVGQDTALAPVTRHLARAKVLMWLFDPTQDPRFRAICAPISKDPQITEATQTLRQETILSEAALRIRKHRGLSAYQRHDAPLLVLMGKSDIWAPLIQEDISAEPIIPPKSAGELASVDMARIERISGALRNLLLKVAPEIVTAAEDLSQQVVYIPVSALGHSPQRIAQETGAAAGPGLLIRPRDIQPHWTTIPLLYSFARWSAGLIGGNSD